MALLAWILDHAPGHEGSLIGLVPCEDPRRRTDGYRELSFHDDLAALNGIFLNWVQVGCTCGWRSERLDAPIGACWWPAYVDVPDHFEVKGRLIWRAHAIATVVREMTPRAGTGDES